jgi:GxxExxY protein
MNRKLSEKDLPDASVTREIIAAAYAVHGKLGAGFLEKVYENALAIEIAKRGLKVLQQCPLPVLYEGQVVGEYFADLVVEDRVICELKAIEAIARRHEAQLVNYLAATGFDTGLLINFAERVAVRRKFRIYRSSC